jgi:hypothetical protein
LSEAQWPPPLAIHLIDRQPEKESVMIVKLTSLLIAALLLSSATVAAGFLVECSMQAWSSKG